MIPQVIAKIRQNLALSLVAVIAAVGGGSYALPHVLKNGKTPAEAVAAPVGSTIETTFVVASTFRPKNMQTGSVAPFCLLNNYKYSRTGNPADFVTVKWTYAGDEKALIGKTVCVKGNKVTYRGQPQIEATSVEVK